MSNFDLLTPEEVSQAKLLGWELCEVYDLATERLRVQVWPANKTDYVIHLAKRHNALAIKALRLIAHGPQPRRKK